MVKPYQPNKPFGGKLVKMPRVGGGKSGFPKLDTTLGPKKKPGPRKRSSLAFPMELKLPKPSGRY